MDVSFSLPTPTVMLAEVSRAAVSFAGNDSLIGFVTNSLFVAAVVLATILIVARKATNKMTLVPHKWQNFFELVVEFLYDRVEGIVGKSVAPRAFPLLATLFVFILVSNYFGLLPGVGTIGWGHGSSAVNLSHIDAPLLRPATADLNMTLGMAICFMLVWLFITIREGPEKLRPFAVRWVSSASLSILSVPKAA